MKALATKKTDYGPGNPGYEQARAAADYILKNGRFRPRAGMILGSGLGHVVEPLKSEANIPYHSIPHFPRPTVEGHGGFLHLGWWGNLPMAVMAGRMHLYEGYSPAEVVLPTRVLALAGVEILIVTCAAGGINKLAIPGTLMVIKDHLNYQGMNPLVGLHDPRWGERFIDMTQAYDPELRRLAARAAKAERVRMFEGVYVSLLGPSFETPAEIRALGRLGADAVGMSTVPEVIAARQLGLRVLGLASITNRAAGLSRRPLSHHEVLETGAQASGNLVALLEGLIGKLDECKSERKPGGKKGA
ncbi:MAG TPA: purine-nucleoside phosphorylase [Terriglobia bacterium]|nr:purine-nucleoside phosphorylase [Terriglobia bacterium]